MLKNILLIILLSFGSLSYGMSSKSNNIQQDKNINKQIESTFKKMMNYYQNENESNFFSLVDKNSFLEDYMLFRQAIEKDFRTYDVLDFEYWIDKITSDGTKRYLYVKWKKTYQTINGTGTFIKKGYSRLLFDKVNGSYKLVELAGDVLYGNSLSEWKTRVPHI